MQHVGYSKHALAEEQSANPFRDRRSTQFGIQPEEAAENVDSQRSRSAPAESRGHLRGSAADLLERNRRRNQPATLPGQSQQPWSMNLRGTLSRDTTPASFSATALPDEQAAPVHEQMLDTDNVHDINDRVDKLEHANEDNFRYVYELQLRVHSLENNMSLVL